MNKKFAGPGKLRSWSLLLIIAVLLSLCISSEIPGASAAITRVQGNARGYAASGTTVTVTLASTPTLGNTLIAVVDFYDFSIASFSQTGVTWDASYSVESNANDIWKGLVTSSSASKTITVTTTRAINTNQYHFGCVVDVCEYTGNLILDKSAMSGSGLRNPALTGTTATTTSTDEVWVGAITAWVSGGNSVQSSPGNGFTLMDGASYQPGSVSGSLSFLEKIVSSTGAASSSTALQGTYWNSGCIAAFKLNPNVDITFYFNSGGIFQRDSITVSNGTVYSAPPGTGIVLSGLANSGSGWLYFSWAGNSSYTTSNPYTYTPSAADTIWCYFGGGGSSGPNLPFEGAAAGAAILLFFMLFVGLVALAKRR